MMEDEPAATRADSSAARPGPDGVDGGLGISCPVAHGRRKPGRRPKLSEEQQAEIVDEVCSGRRIAAEMARHFRVSEPTVSRVLAPHRARARVCVAAGQDSALPAAERIAGVLPASALGSRIAIVGTSGSGKTYAAKGLVEHLLGRGARVCVVDPLGVWWGLRVAAESGAPALYPVVVFGGAHADVPLDPGMGAALGHLVGTRPLACVVDVFDLGSAAARRAFMTAFTEALYGANTEPLHLVLDEADLWAPQRVQQDGFDLLGRVEEIVRRGRVRGFVPWLITQRPAVLHKLGHFASVLLRCARDSRSRPSADILSYQAHARKRTAGQQPMRSPERASIRRHRAGTQIREHMHDVIRFAEIDALTA